MRCPKVLRWLCGNRGQKRAVREATERFHRAEAESRLATQRIKRDSFSSALYPDRSRGESS
jgi:hypothetical protein